MCTECSEAKRKSEKTPFRRTAPCHNEQSHVRHFPIGCGTFRCRLQPPIAYRGRFGSRNWWANTTWCIWRLILITKQKQYTTLYQHRTLQQLSMDPDDNSTNTSLFGVVEKTAKGKEEEDDDGSVETSNGEDEDEEASVPLFDDRFTFRTVPPEPRQDGSSLSFQLVVIPSDCDKGEVHGHLQVLGRTEACPWIPHGDYRRGPRCHFWMVWHHLPPFASLEAAREANHRQAHHVPEWMEHHPLRLCPPRCCVPYINFATNRPRRSPRLFSSLNPATCCFV